MTLHITDMALDLAYDKRAERTVLPEAYINMETAAQIKLIEAAPELLAVAEWIMHHAPLPPELVKMAQAAIATAEG